MHIDSELADHLVRNNIFRVTFSFSGVNRDDYERIYVNGNYEKVTAAIGILASARRKAGKKYPIIEINSLGFIHHVDNFEQFVEMMSDRGVDVIYLKRLQTLSYIPELYQHASIPREWKEVVSVKRAIAIRAGPRRRCVL